MVNYKRGNIFTSKMQTLVNPVNCVGVMGAGLALQFKNKYPDMFSVYCMACQEKKIRPGKLFYYQTDSGTGVLLFPTKDHWRNQSKIEYIENGLDDFIRNYQQLNISSVAFPALGCGYGGLSLNLVVPLMAEMLRSVDIPVELYLPPTR